MRHKRSKSIGTLVMLCVFAIQAAFSLFAREVTIQDKSLLVSFDSHSGALTRLVDKSDNWIIERRPELGISFRLFVPLPDRRYNPVLGEKQKATVVKKLSNHEILLQWTNLVSENGGVLPIGITSMVGLTNGALVFNTTLQNNSALTVETVDYPYLGDCNPPTRDSSLEIVEPRDKNRQSEELYPHFHNEKGYWGDFYPLKTREAKPNPYCLIQSTGEGIYVGMGVSPLPYRLQYTFEQHPGVVSSVNELVPPEDKISGTPVHLEVRTCHFVFAGAQSSTNLVPVILRCYHGDAQAGAALHEQSIPAGLQ